MAKQRAKWRCAACGAPHTPDDPLHVDHVNPLEHGGDPYDLDNLRVLCQYHHIRARGSVPQHPPEEYAERNRRARERREQDKAKPPLDWEGLSLDEQADRVRAHRQGRVLVTPPTARRPGRRKGRQRYTRAERAAYHAKRAAEREELERLYGSPGRPGVPPQRTPEQEARRAAAAAERRAALGLDADQPRAAPKIAASKIAASKVAAAKVAKTPMTWTDWLGWAVVLAIPGVALVSLAAHWLGY